MLPTAPKQRPKSEKATSYDPFVSSDESDYMENLYDRYFPAQNPRKQEYPSAENRREYTSRDPPAPKSTTPPRPKPRPKARKATTSLSIPPPLTQFEKLMAMSLTNVLKEIVQRCHDPKLTWITFIQEYPHIRDQRRQLLRVRAFNYSYILASMILNVF